MERSQLAEANKKIAAGVTSGYRKIEDGVVSGYRKIEDRFVEAFLARDGESIDAAKQRLAAERDGRPRPEAACGNVRTSAGETAGAAERFNGPSPRGGCANPGKEVQQ